MTELGRGYYKITLEAEDERAFRRQWSRRDWEDEIAAGHVTVHVLDVVYERLKCSRCSHDVHPIPPEGENCGCYDPEGVCGVVSSPDKATDTQAADRE